MKTRICAFLAMFLIGVSGFANAAGDSSYNDSRFDSIYKLIDKQKYSDALEELTAIEDKDADVFNLMGFSNRKLMNYDEAFVYYQKALSLEPEHKGANEYLGELYLETGKLDKAEERLAILDDVCIFTCLEYRKLKYAINKYKEENDI